MVKLKEQGKVRYIGVSNFTVAQLERARGISPPVSLQPPYSMIRRDAEDELLGYCNGHLSGSVRSLSFGTWCIRRCHTGRAQREADGE